MRCHPRARARWLRRFPGAGTPRRWSTPGWGRWWSWFRTRFLLSSGLLALRAQCLLSASRPFVCRHDRSRAHVVSEDWLHAGAMTVIRLGPILLATALTPERDHLAILMADFPGLQLGFATFEVLEEAYGCFDHLSYFP